MKVTLNESHIAWAAYEGALPALQRLNRRMPCRSRVVTSSCPATWPA